MRGVGSRREKSWFAECMHITRVVPHLTVFDIEQAVAEHRAALGMTVLMNHGWIVTLGDDAGHELSGRVVNVGAHTA